MQGPAVFPSGAWTSRSSPASPRAALAAEYRLGACRDAEEAAHERPHDRRHAHGSPDPRQRHVRPRGHRGCPARSPGKPTVPDTDAQRLESARQTSRTWKAAGNRAGHAGDREQHESGKDHGTAAVAVAERPGQRLADAQAEQVGSDEELGLSLAHGIPLGQAPPRVGTTTIMPNGERELARLSSQSEGAGRVVNGAASRSPE